MAAISPVILKRKKAFGKKGRPCMGKSGGPQRGNPAVVAAESLLVLAPAVTQAANDWPATIRFAGNRRPAAGCGDGARRSALPHAKSYY
jgi:hypothetical protein